MVRICSLLPSATEIVCALGLQDDLVAITHECDYPPGLEITPRITSSVVDSDSLGSRDIDNAIKLALDNLSTIYRLDRDRLAELQPDLILTQELCEVCAVSFAEVEACAREICPGADVVSLEPDSLAGILGTIQTVGGRAGVTARADTLLKELKNRLDQVEARARRATRRPRVLALEWLDPLFIGGHWVPEMVDLAGGIDVLGFPGTRSRVITWTDVVDANADIIVLMPCGFDLARTVAEFHAVATSDEWMRLPAARAGQVFAVDGSAYFNRPGPRVVDGVEILAGILQPDIFGPASAHQVQQVLAESTRLAPRGA
ncbi:MAG TPA: cobalamin-binding protein [Chloroflexota bacterium]|jgi:iron complex transport system substrate-binding protein|nr:cobalamin-binding protein [Chloroflexota bacterium]